MDLDVKQFEEAWYDFRSRSKELERRLGSVITQGFDDCTTITGQFKLLDSFDTLVNRPIIADELEKKNLLPDQINTETKEGFSVTYCFNAKAKLDNRDTDPLCQ